MQIYIVLKNILNYNWLKTVLKNDSSLHDRWPRVFKNLLRIVSLSITSSRHRFCSYQCLAFLVSPFLAICWRMDEDVTETKSYDRSTRGVAPTAFAHMSPSSNPRRFQNLYFTGISNLNRFINFNFYIIWLGYMRYLFSNALISNCYKWQ